MSRIFTIQNGSLIFKRKYETVRIEGWGENALRVRATENHAFTSEDWALTECVNHEADAFIEERTAPGGGKEVVAVIKNGKIRAEMTESGRIRFLNQKGEVLLKEHYQAMDVDRNEGMLDVAIDYLESGDVVFYAVGLAHLLDHTNGLVNALQEAGYTVELVAYQ